MWIIHAHAPLTANRTEIEPEQSWCLSEHSTRINISGLAFNFPFTIIEETGSVTEAAETASQERASTETKNVAHWVEDGLCFTRRREYFGKR